MVCVFVFFLFSLNLPHSCYEIKRDVFCSRSYIFISLSLLWAVCHVVSYRGNVQCSSRALVCDVLCDGCGRSFSVLACESGLLFKIHVWFLRTCGPGGPWACGCVSMRTAWSDLKPQEFLAHFHLPVMTHLAKTRKMTENEDRKFLCAVNSG